MRILVLHSRYRSGPASGENRVVDDETLLLSRAGHQVNVFSPSVGQPVGLEMIKAGAGTIWSIEAAAETKRRIESWNPDIVHCHNLYPALSPSVIRAVNGRVPVIMTLHNYRLLCLPATFLRDGRICEDCLHRRPWPGIVHRCYRQSLPGSAAMASSLTLHRALGSFDRIGLYIAISQFVRLKHVQAGLPAGKIDVKPHFSWAMERREGPGDYFLYLGRLSPEKGVATLLAAWEDVPAKLLIVGDGPSGRQLRGKAPANVEFRPSVGADTVPELLRRARAVLAPSVSHEGAGRVVVEAYAAGVPVLVSRAGGLPEAVQEGVTGLVLPPNDVRAWRGAVQHLLQDSESERMGTAAWALWSTRYTPDHAILNLLECYRHGMDLSSREG